MFRIIPFAAAIATACIIAGAAAAPAAKPTDREIAHIAYTAGLIYVYAGKQAPRQVQERSRARLLRNRWSATTPP